MIAPAQYVEALLNEFREDARSFGGKLEMVGRPLVVGDEVAVVGSAEFPGEKIPEGYKTLELTVERLSKSDPFFLSKIAPGRRVVVQFPGLHRQ
jgi:hypothetical protein